MKRQLAILKSNWTSRNDESPILRDISRKNIKTAIRVIRLINR